ncbi:MAG: sugar phosphate isomerase/epimerase [Armatimonadetes bacterium]|nr:sugar phosphate isomerase/epimerase [Armatimonadota bacterium]
MRPPLIMHINYCQKGEAVRDVCRSAVARGFDGVEFPHAPVGGVPCAPEEYLDSIAREQKASGLRLVLFGVHVRFLFPDPAQRAAAIRETATFLQLAAERLDVVLCNTAASGPLLQPSATASDDLFRIYAEGYQRLGDVAAELGLRIAFEVHPGFPHDLPEPTMRLVELVDRPNVGVNLDYGNIVYMERAPSLEDSIRIVAGKLTYVHVKNSIGIPGGSRFQVGLPDGDINHRAYLRLLRQAGYAGPFGLEFPRGGDREWHARRDIRYLKSVLSDLSRE